MGQVASRLQPMECSIPCTLRMGYLHEVNRMVPRMMPVYGCLYLKKSSLILRLHSSLQACDANLWGIHLAQLQWIIGFIVGGIISLEPLVSIFRPHLLNIQPPLIPS